MKQSKKLEWSRCRLPKFICTRTKYCLLVFILSWAKNQYTLGIQPPAMNGCFLEPEEGLSDEVFSLFCAFICLGTFFLRNARGTITYVRIYLATLEGGGVIRVCNEFEKLMPNFDWMKQCRYNNK